MKLDTIIEIINGISISHLKIVCSIVSQIYKEDTIPLTCFQSCQLYGFSFQDIKLHSFSLLPGLNWALMYFPFRNAAAIADVIDGDLSGETSFTLRMNIVEVIFHYTA